MWWMAFNSSSLYIVQYVMFMATVNQDPPVHTMKDEW
jgi:hypothetical protein